MIFADESIQTADLSNWKRLLNQLSHNHCPLSRKKFIRKKKSITKLVNKNTQNACAKLERKTQLKIACADYSDQCRSLVQINVSLSEIKNSDVSINLQGCHAYKHDSQYFDRHNGRHISSVPYPPPPFSKTHSRNLIGERGQILNDGTIAIHCFLANCRRRTVSAFYNSMIK